MSGHDRELEARRAEARVDDPAVGETGNLRAETQARLVRLRPGDAIGLADLISANEREGRRILEVAAGRLGNSTVQRAFAILERRRAPGSQIADRSDATQRDAQNDGTTRDESLAPAELPAGGGSRNEAVERTAASGFAGAPESIPFRSEMETSFGESFADVRAHRGAEASHAGGALGARAYAMGNDVAFADDNPSKEVVAHELTHVVQQRGGTAGVQAKSAASTPSDAHELEADRVAATVSRGGSVAGMISQRASTTVSLLDAWDIVGVTGGSMTGAAGRELAEHSPYRQLIADITASILQSPAEGFALLKDELKEHWYEFLQTTATLIAVELGIGALVATPSPGAATQIAAVILQALMLTFLFYAAYTEGPETIKWAQTWWTTVSNARGNPEAIHEAAKAFAQLVFHMIQAIMAVGGMAGMARAGLRLGQEPIAVKPMKGEHRPGRSNAGGKSQVAGTHNDGSSTPSAGSIEHRIDTAETNDVKAAGDDAVVRVAETSKGRGLPEYPVSKYSIKQDLTEQPHFFAVSFSTEIEGRVVDLGNGKVQLADGEPADLPDLTLHADYRQSGQDYAVHIYDSVSPTKSGIPKGEGNRTPLTDYALEKFDERYAKRFGQPPEGYFGQLIESNRLNFQREYVRLRRTGMSSDRAAVEAVKKISFGAHRASRGYSHFEVELGNLRRVDLGGDLGVQDDVPTSIEVIARRK